MHVFFRPGIQDDMVMLDPEESHHCVKVLRMRPGQEVQLTDGEGRAWQAVLAEASSRGCLLQITGEPQLSPARPFELHLAVAPTKNIDRFEWLLEKATECGVDQITPVICENSERTVIKPERLHKILVSAMKQSQRNWLPRLNQAARLESMLKQPLRGRKLIAHCAQGEKKTLRDCYTRGESVLVLIGPEGDFSTQEVKAALQGGFEAITLGNHRLRTETAALALCIQLNTMNDLL